MKKMLNSFERIVVFGLLGLMMVAVCLATVELAVILVKELAKPPVLLLDVKKLLEVFSFFLMVLIGLELIESVKAYLHDDVIHAEIVLLVALVAVARKVIILNYKEVDPSLLFGISSIIIALGIAYYLIRKCPGFPNSKSSADDE